MKKINQSIATIIALVSLSGCSSFQSIESRAPVSDGPQTTVQNSDYDLLMQSFSRYEGVPYVYGGTDARGFDCSGFINAVYEEAFGFDLPRTTEQIVRQGKVIRQDQLRAGDIVVFKTGFKQLHAGIYTGNGQFIHASTSKGVMQSSLDNVYWRKHYIQSRRYL